MLLNHSFAECFQKPLITFCSVSSDDKFTQKNEFILIYFLTLKNKVENNYKNK